MSAYENVVAGKLRLKGKPLEVKCGSVHKKSKKKNRGGSSIFSSTDTYKGGKTTISAYQEKDANEADKSEDGHTLKFVDQLTPAEKRYYEQTKKLELQRLAKMAAKSHRDRIQELNTYLANLTEHYDIPKVGPG